MYLLVGDKAQWRTHSSWMLRCPKSIPGRGKKYSFSPLKISGLCYLKCEFEHDDLGSLLVDLTEKL